MRWNERPGELVATATPDGEVEQDDTRTVRSRDAACYLLAVGETLVGIEPNSYGYGMQFRFAQSDTFRRELRRWRGDGVPMVDGRRFADAATLIRRLMRDGVTQMQPTRLSEKEALSNEQGRSA